MKALAAFLFRYKDLPEYSPGELRLIYNDRFLDINDTLTWFTFAMHHSGIRNAAELIEYHRQCANWLEIDL